MGVDGAAESAAIEISSQKSAVFFWRRNGFSTEKVSNHRKPRSQKIKSGLTIRDILSLQREITFIPGTILASNPRSRYLLLLLLLPRILALFAVRLFITQGTRQPGLYLRLAYAVGRDNEL